MVTLSCEINVTWCKPDDNGCPLTMYSVYYQEISPQENETPQHEVNINEVSNNQRVLPLRCDTQYAVVEVSAWNVLGQSEKSTKWTIKTTKSKTSCKFPRTGVFCWGYGGREGGGLTKRFRASSVATQSSDRSPS